MTSAKIKKRIEQLCIDLDESEGTRTQNFTTLAENVGKEVKTYCALGALGCQQKLIYTYQEDGIDGWTLKDPPYDAIINSYGLSNKMTKAYVFPLRMIDYRGKPRSVDIGTYTKLSTLIVDCNDEGHMSFAEISQLIRVIAKQGFFKICSDRAKKKAEQYKLVEEVNP